MQVSEEQENHMLIFSVNTDFFPWIFFAFSTIDSLGADPAKEVSMWHFIL